MPENGFIVVTQVGSQTFGIVVDGVFHTEEIVVKPMSTQAAPHRDVLRQHHPRRRLGDHDHRSERHRAGARHCGASQREIAETRTRAARDADAEQLISLLVFRAGSHAAEGRAAVAGHAPRRDRRQTRSSVSNGRHLVQYRGQLMPLVRACEGVKVRSEGAQPLLVFADDGRSMGLVVDEIVDIVEERLNIEVGSDARRACSARPSSRARRPRSSTSGISCRWRSRTGSAARKARVERRRRRCCWSTTRAFFRNMLTPVLKAAGYDVTAARARSEALEHRCERASDFDVDRHRHRDAGHERLRARRSAPRRSAHRRHADHRAVVA